MEHFNILILIGRPASGKSEILDYLLHLPAAEREARFHLGELDVLDDFPLLWSWFEEDHLLATRFNAPRLHTDEQGYFQYDYLWHLLIERLDQEYHKRTRDDPGYHARTSTLFEFSRGSEHGGYREAFRHFSEGVLEQAGVVYVQVSYAESLRKNRRRFNPERPDSILEHGLPDEKMERLYRVDDWEELATPNPDHLHLGDLRVPYAIFENEDDVTTNTPDLLAARLEQVLDRLWMTFQGNSQKVIK